MTAIQSSCNPVAPSNKIDREVLLERVSGCLLGMAIGDGMGLPAEGLSPYQVACKFHFIDGFFPVGGNIGNYSCETRGAIMVAKSILEKRGAIDRESILAAVAALAENDPVILPGKGRRIFSRTIPIAIAAAATGMDDQALVQACRFVAEEKASKSESLAYFIFAKTLSEILRNAGDLSGAYELYESDRSLIHRMDTICSKAEAKMEEAGPSNRLCDRLSFTQKRLMDKKCGHEKFYGCMGSSGNSHESLAMALFCFLRAPDEFATVCEAVSLGGPSTVHGAMVGALVGAYIGVSAKTFPADMKDSVQNGAKLESLAVALTDCYAGKES